jgi:hypothetical protein
VAVILALGGPKPAVQEIGPGLTVHRRAAVVLVVDPPAMGSVPRMLDDLRAADVGSIDVLVLRAGGRAALTALSVIRRSRDVRLVVAPRGSGARRAWLIGEPVHIGVGGLELVIAPDGDHTLAVSIRRIAGMSDAPLEPPRG